jgi:hypothetical protein
VPFDCKIINIYICFLEFIDKKLEDDDETDDDVYILHVKIITSI